ncbi:Bud site selection protein 6 [Myotisia sp. PD_48]|nr:Bud site selection protein 6 [Myotisia sp. PD_48]
MDSYPASRPPQRRSPGADQSYPPTNAAGSGSNDVNTPSGMRTSSGSGRSSSSTEKQLSQIEKSVTHLLVATKQLLEKLTEWSRQLASETEVSDVYVRLGYEFNLACRAFGAIGMDTTDLGPVPDRLRSILEDTLSQDASPQSLDRYLPRIRDIIINLLHGLKRKQAKLRSRQAREGRTLPPRQASSGAFDAENGTQPPEDTPTAGPSSQRRPGPPRQGGSYDEHQTPSSFPRNTSSPWSGAPGGSFAEREANRHESQRSTVPSTPSSSISSFTMQNMPILPPQAEDATLGRNESISDSLQNFPHPPPPPPPKQNDAIGLLQRSGELERRASRRYSAYQIQKHLGASPNGVPVLPSSQNPPVNRGRDVRESMNAVRLRGSHFHGQQRSRNRFAETPSTKATPVVYEEPSSLKVESAAEPTQVESPAPKKPTAKFLSPQDFDEPDLSGTLSGVPQFPEVALFPAAGDKPTSPKEDQAPALQIIEPKLPSTPTEAPRVTGFNAEASPPSTKELTLFLQYKSKIKKYVFPEGYADLTIARLQLAFIEKFAWNTHSNGADLPEIYIQDPVSGIRHELEDLRDVKDRSVLVLNVEALDEVKKHFDEGVGGIRELVEGVREIVNSQGASIQRLMDRQQDTVKEITRLASEAEHIPKQSVPVRLSSGEGWSLNELQSLRRDLGALRQTYTSFTSDMATAMGTIRTKAGQVKTTAADISIPSYEGDAGRARVQAGKKELADESEKLVARVDDLQDLVEDLRKDVVTRGVRPAPRQLEAVGRDISSVTKELKKMQEFLRREKPIWTKIWEKELQLVCEERDQLTMQEDLAIDLEDDLDKATQTFALVEQATKQQNLDSTNGTSGTVGPTRNVSRNLPIDQTADPMKAKDNLLGEVRALQPNHENRLEAIERAEKMRQRDLENRRTGLFQNELATFVNDGKLKKNGGGIEEAERLRNAKDESLRRGVWDQMQDNIAPSTGSPTHQPSETTSESSEHTAELGEQARILTPEQGDDVTDGGNSTPKDTPDQQVHSGRTSTDAPDCPRSTPHLLLLLASSPLLISPVDASLRSRVQQLVEGWQQYSDDYTAGAAHVARDVGHGPGSPPSLVRKMSIDAGEKFWPEYWNKLALHEANATSLNTRDRRSPELQDELACSGGNTTVQVFQAPYALHSTDQPHPLILFGRTMLEFNPPALLLGKRQFRCPAGTSPCNSIDRPNSCCNTSDTCQIVEDTGLGDVGCCSEGSVCSGEIHSCPEGFKSCPDHDGGGCCTPGYTCVDQGCLQVTTATVIITRPTSSIPSSTVSSVPTTTSRPTEPSTTSGSVSAPVRPTSNSITTAETLTEPPTSTEEIPDVCPTGFYACRAVYNGGCCRTGRDCESTSCPSISLTTLTSNGVTIVVPADTTSNQNPTQAPGRCADGWSMCASTFGGGCCPDGFSCGEISCTSSATGIGTETAGKIAPENSANMFDAWRLSALIWVIVVQATLLGNW